MKLLRFLPLLFPLGVLVFACWLFGAFHYRIEQNIIGGSPDGFEVSTVIWRGKIVKSYYSWQNGGSFNLPASKVDSVKNEQLLRAKAWIKEYEALTD